VSPENIYTDLTTPSKLERPGWPNFTFAFHDSEEIGPMALSRLAKNTGLRPEDL
jgi:hypothetical protein